MYKKCQVCVNCGRCNTYDNTNKKISIVTKNLYPFPSISLENKGKRRLVTVDIGTTTIAMQLFDTDGKLADTYVQVNPQTMYGADVISRIEAADNTGKAAHMKKMIHGVIQKGTERFKALLAEEETFLFVVVGNTTMIYLFMGWRVNLLGKAPFIANHLEGFFTEVTEEKFPCYVCPGLSAFVGSDITAGIVAVDLLQKESYTLLIDLGTNGEMVLGNKDGALALATAAGPAFEGGANRGVWGADMISLTSTLLSKGILDETGLLQNPYFESGIRIGDVLITNDAIRTLQYAKAAIASGIQILCEKSNCQKEQIGQVVLAGGFGYYLSASAACDIGLLPEALEERTVAGGNTALAGAKKIGHLILQQESLLENKEMEREMFEREIVEKKKIQTINLAMQQNFSEEYIDAIALKRM